MFNVIKVRPKKKNKTQKILFEKMRLEFKVKKTRQYTREIVERVCLYLLEFENKRKIK